MEALDRLKASQQADTAVKCIQIASYVTLSASQAEGRLYFLCLASQQQVP